MGPRHWHYELDADIAKAALDAGFIETSTDAGAKQFGKKGVGTIPHALENVMAHYYGKENAEGITGFFDGKTKLS